jgi:hypothetical protein
MTDSMEGLTTYLLVLACGAAGVWRSWRDLRRARASAAWPRADGDIVGSAARVEDYHDDGEPMLRTVISYRYHVGGEPYRGERVFFGDGIALRFAGPGRRRLAAYPIGRRVRVAYDPADPAISVLEPGEDDAALLACLVAATVALVGVAGLLARP